MEKQEVKQKQVQKEEIKCPNLIGDSSSSKKGQLKIDIQKNDPVPIKI
jgi:hypothetical protein